jgi:hypothetical protein
MRQFICLLVAFLFLLCGCSQNSRTNPTDIESFSYKSDYDHYKDEPGVKESGFVNVEQTIVDSSEKAVNLAKKECTVEYDTVRVAFDSELKIYRVSFSKKNRAGENQDVYINQNGITQLIICGE